jgi:hypothetical protein
MLLYMLVMMFSLIGCLLVATLALPPPSQAPGGLYILMTLLLALVLAPASTLLCAVFFGSWGGVLVSFFSIYGGIELTRLVNQQFWSTMSLEDSLTLFIPALVVTFVVGASYDFRKEPNTAMSTLIMFVGAPVLVFVFLGLCTTGSSLAWDEGGLIFCCSNLFLIPSWALLVVGIEESVQEVVSNRRQRW